MKKTYLIFLSLALILLVSCGGEGYVSVKNDTPSDILLSLNNAADEVVATGDTSDTYTVAVMKGVVNNISVEASGEWVGNYSGTIALTDGETVVHRITPQVADITLTNLSVDSANCVLEGYDTLYFTGEDSITDKFTVDGNVSIVYAGRYMFEEMETMSWMPGYTYRYELTPNACEIQMNNVHTIYTVYYVYISESTSQSWGEDQLGNDVVESGYGYVWKAEGDVKWDMRIEAAHPHADSTTMHVYEYYDTDPGCTSDFTWIYEFPTIFAGASASSASKVSPENNVMKPASLSKAWNSMPTPSRIEKIRKVDAGKAGLKALRK